MNDKLAISEMFYSIQGEGLHCGMPSIFLRLQGCNLTCGGANTIKTQSPDDNAEWRCDTIEVWLKGKALSFNEIINQWKKNGWLELLKQNTHLVITGGEPFLQMKRLESFLEYLYKTESFLPYIECETNGTIKPTQKIDSQINQYNVSLKLKNSGMKKIDYFKKQAIHYFCKTDKSIFKFVVSGEKDINELVSTYQKPFDIDNNKIMLMPAADNKKTLAKLEPSVIEWCKTFQFRYSPRLHIHIWDKKTGV